jgi:hypothetical protein
MLSTARTGMPLTSTVPRIGPALAPSKRGAFHAHRVLYLFAGWRYPPAMPEPVELKPATPEDLAEALAFALRCSG